VRGESGEVVLAVAGPIETRQRVPEPAVARYDPDGMNDSRMAARIAALLAMAALVSCKSGDAARASSAARSSVSAPVPSAESSAASSARPRRETRPAPAPVPLVIPSSDGIRLGASLYQGGAGSAPAIVLVHRMAGTRAEWVPLLERLLPPKAPMNVLALDLRGHGESVERAGSPKKLRWHELTSAQWAETRKDVEAALSAMDKRGDGPPSSVVLVGSDIGATAALLAAPAAGARLLGVALVSPGAALQGIDAYRPFGAVLGLPNLIVAGNTDNTSREAARVLKAMSASSVLVELEAAEHGAEYLGSRHPEAWDALADWVEARVTASSR
jgi:pimeloyl-ACP methyl ester carboxylesterase